MRCEEANGDAALFRLTGDAAAKALLSPWAVPEPADWARHVNAPQTEAELAAVRRSLVGGTPYGSASWTERTARRLGLDHTLRDRGRPKKAGKEA